MQIERRQFVAAPQGFARQRHRRPNLLFVFSDQQSYDMLGCNGNPQILTPNKVRGNCEDTPERREAYAGHMAMCTSLDTCMGQLLVADGRSGAGEVQPVV